MPNQDELIDDFDVAIEILQSFPGSTRTVSAATEMIAVNLLIAKRQLPRAEATDLVKRAAAYLGG